MELQHGDDRPTMSGIGPTLEGGEGTRRMVLEISLTSDAHNISYDRYGQPYLCSFKTSE